MTLHMLHGCSPEWDNQQECFRNYVPVSALRSFLDRRPRAYGKWNEIGGVDHLSIDDSTRGAAAACRLARSLGHEVTLFVNPRQIDIGQPYFFSLLDSVLDNRRRNTLRFNGVDFDVSRREQRRSFRISVRAKLSMIDYEPAVSVVMQLAEMLQSVSIEVKEHAHIITRDELRQLQQIGVTVGNHGWTHADISHLSPSEFCYHITEADKWIAEVLGTAPFGYAVPFGRCFVLPSFRRLLARPVFLANGHLRSGRVKTSHWNRTEITDEIQQRV